MIPIKERIERLKIKYDLKREYFTLGIPVAIAIVMIVVAFGIGQVDLPGASNQTAQVSDKEKAYQDLMAQLNSENGVVTDTSQTNKTEQPKQKWGLDQVLIFSTLVAIIPYSIDITIQKRKTRRKEELYTEFLFKLSELMRGGLDPIKAVKELSKTDLGDLSPHVKMAATALTFGKSFEESMKRMAKSLQSEVVRRYTSLVIQASYSGGSVSDLILKASEDMRSILGIEREKEGSLSQYTFIFYFAQGIIVFIAYIMITSLLPYLTGLGGTSLLGGGKNQLAGMNFALGFFHLLMINAFFGGLIIGKITEGDAKYGLKHSAVLMIGCYIASMVLIVPPVAAPVQGKVNITVVSGGDQTGLPGLPLARPIVFRVTNLTGSPLEKENVQFSISPDGKVNPLSDNTLKDGTAQVRVVLGANQVTYIIEAKAEGVSKRVSIDTGSAVPV